MMINSESPIHEPARGGGQSRVHITFDVEIGGVVKKKELPFVVGVLADLSGHPSARLPPFMERKAIQIDRANFNEVLSRAGARLALRVPNRLTDPDTSLLVELRFGSLADFAPTRVAEQIAPLKQLLDKRRELEQTSGRTETAPNSGALFAEILANTERARGRDPESAVHAPPQESAVMSLEQDRINEIDRMLSAQLNEVLHHPDFQRLEGTWRGLHYLVSQTETGDNLKIRVLNVSMKELFQDQEKAAKFDQSFLFKKIHDETYASLGGEPYGLWVGDYQFSHAREDLYLLKAISQIAAAAHAPFVAAVSPKMFNLDRFSELAGVKSLPKIFESVAHAAWKSFRESPESRYVVLTLPRVLYRLPYGASSQRVAEFNFEEEVDGPDHDRFAWMSSAWVYATRITAAAARWGWMARIRGVEGGGKIEGLPVQCFPTTRGDIALKCSTEIAIADERHEFELSNLGFLAPMQWKHEELAVFMGVQSCHKPAKYHDAAATAAAELTAKVNCLLCASRFMHYLKVLARDRIGPMTVAEWQRRLNGWIQNYCEQGEEISETGSPERPLADAHVEVKPVTGKPGWHKLVVDLVPYFQLENVAAALRLEAEIPRIR
jgi:type VI secretion system protein ImpC